MNKLQSIRKPGSQREALTNRIQQGMDALKNQDNVEAFDIFSEILEQNPKVAIAHVGMGRVFSHEGEDQKALEHFQEALSLKPDLAPAIFFSGQSREKLGDTEAALADYEEALQVDPSIGRGQMRLSRLLEQEDRQEDAAAYLQDAIMRAPQDASLRLLLAGLYDRTGEHAKSEVELTRAVELRPDLWIAQYQFGRAKLRHKDYAAARTALEAAASMTTDKPLIQFALGSALEGLGEYAKAIKAFEEAYRLNPRMVRAAVDAAQCKAKMGKGEQALAELHKMARGRRQIVIVQKAIGDIYFDMGKSQDAIEYYRASVLNAHSDEERPAELQAVLDLADDDVDALARRYHDALAARAEKIGVEFRDDPKVLRNKVSARMDRVTSS
jgi:tetratricopeptide (TPR) repeat protein